MFIENLVVVDVEINSGSSLVMSGIVVYVWFCVFFLDDVN